MKNLWNSSAIFYYLFNSFQVFSQTDLNDPPKLESDGTLKEIGAILQ